MSVILGYAAAIIMGLSLGLIGGGGSILTVPILVYIFLIDPVTATSYSLFIVGATALVGGYSYFRRGDVDLKTGFIFAIPSFIGVYLTRAYIVPSLPDVLFRWDYVVVNKALLMMLVFAGLMLAASVSMIRSKSNPVSGALAGLSSPVRIILIGIEGLVVGAVTGFVGAGGGFLIIPALVLLVGMPMKLAVGTSLFIIAAKSLLGFIGDLQAEVSMDWYLLYTLTIVAIVGLKFGVSFSSKIPEQKLKKAFGYFVLIMGVFILIDQSFRMFS